MRKLNQNGHVLIFFTLSFVLLSLFIGLAVDGGRAYFLKAALARKVDPASLAAAAKISAGISAAQEAACDTVKMNGLDCSGLTVTQVTVTDASGKNVQGVQVLATSTMPTTFMRMGTLIGCGAVCESIAVAASAVAAPGGNLDLVMDLDNTGSMAGAKIGAAKTGANALVDAMLPGGSSSFALLSLVPFQGCYHTTPGSPALSAGCVDSDEYPSSGGDIVSLTNDANNLHNGINALSAPGGSGTNVCEGLTRTRLKLFQSGLARPAAQRYLILLTDAENNFTATKAPWTYPGCIPIGANLNINLGVRTNNLAGQIKNPTSNDAASGQQVGQMVTIFVIMYGSNATGTVPATCNTSLLSDLTASPTSQSYTKNLARCIASDAGDVFLAPNPSDITAAFMAIISRLPVRLVL